MNIFHDNKPLLTMKTPKQYYSSTCLVCLVLFSFIAIFVASKRHETIIRSVLASPMFILKGRNLTNITSNVTVNVQLFESFICDNTNVNRFSPSSTTPSNNSFDAYRKSTLQKYCDIVPIPRRGWINAKTYTEQDVAFVIFTAASLFHTRATAVHDTWLSRITNYYFLSATPYPHLPVTVVDGAGEDKLSNMKKLFYGLQIIYQQQMNFSVHHRQKWFFIAGCDTFVLPHHLLKRLDGLDYTTPILLGGHSGRHVCLGQTNPKIEVEFPTGGAGFFFSMKLLELMQPHLTNYVENVWPRTSEISDVALTCLAAELGIRITRQGGFWHNTPALTLGEHGRKQLHEEPEPNGFHYIKPDEMYALDEFYVNQHMDRLINDEKWKELIEFTRRFVSSHYEL
jgi:hypothetical protein